MDHFFLEEEVKHLHQFTLNRINTAHTVWLASITAQFTILGILIAAGQYTAMFLSVTLSIPFILSMGYQLESIANTRAYLVARYGDGCASFDDKVFSSRIGAGGTQLRLSFVPLSVPQILALPYYTIMIVCLFVWFWSFVDSGQRVLAIATDFSRGAEAGAVVFAAGAMAFALRRFDDSFSQARFDAYLQGWKEHIAAKEGLGIPGAAEAVERP